MRIHLRASKIKELERLYIILTDPDFVYHSSERQRLTALRWNQSCSCWFYPIKCIRTDSKCSSMIPKDRSSASTQFMCSFEII